jgi:hypothetical protein
VGNIGNFKETRDELLKAELEAVARGELDPDDYIYAEANSIASTDIDTALLHIRFWLCLTHIDDVRISFSDGNFGVCVGIWRMFTSAHDCIVMPRKKRKKEIRGWRSNG